MIIKPEVIVAEEPKALAQKGAEIFCLSADRCINQKRPFRVAVSGGSTPRAMHRLLAAEPCFKKKIWSGTHIFWVDERMVPAGHPASNFGAARKDFLDKVPIPPPHVHPMPFEADPEAGAGAYEKTLKVHFQTVGSDLPVFDLIFLGIGTDGHTASLLPGFSPERSAQRWVLAVKGGDPDVFRLTLNYHLLNQARHVVFLVSGKGKARIVKTIFESQKANLPAQRIKPAGGKLTWLMDKDALSQLDNVDNQMKGSA